MIKKVTSDQFLEMPWKNGNGITTEVYRMPADLADEFNFRLSAAKISQDSPFSTFPGVDRHLLILEGKGIMLHHRDQHLKLTDDGQYYSFAGEDQIESYLLGGAVLDFNVMTRRKWGEAKVHLSEHEKVICQSDMTFVYQHGPRPVLWILEPKDSMLVFSPSIIIELKIYNK